MHLPAEAYPSSTAIARRDWNPQPLSNITDRRQSRESPRKHDILIYGAASYVGQLLAEYVVDLECGKCGKGPRGDAPADGKTTYVLAGRTRHKLDALKDKMRKRWVEQGQSAGTLMDRVSVQDFELGVGAEKLEEIVARCSVVINFAGPYSSQSGSALVAACAATGTHYLDLTGETFWVHEMIRRWDFLACQTGAKLVFSCGFDSVPGDVAAYMSALAIAGRPIQGNSKSSPSPKVDSADVTFSRTFYHATGGASGGTIGSVYVVAETPKEARDGGTGEFALVPSLNGKPSPGALGGGQHLGVACTRTGLSGCFFVMSPHNNAIVRRSWALFQNAAAALVGGGSDAHASGDIQYGPEFTYQEAHVLSKKRSATGLGLVGSWLTSLAIVCAGGLFMVSRWFRQAIRRYLPQAGEGPEYSKLRDAWFQVTNVTEAADDRVVVSEMIGEGDPGYYLTARMILECAFCVVPHLTPESALPAVSSRGGVLTPVTAFGTALIDRLAAIERSAGPSGKVDDVRGQGMREFNFWTGTVEEWRERRLQLNEDRKRK